METSTIGSSFAHISRSSFPPEYDDDDDDEDDDDADESDDGGGAIVFVVGVECGLYGQSAEISCS